MGYAMGSALKIRDDLTPLALRRWARVESRGRSAARAYAIANAFEGISRADAARLAGMDRQALRDAVVRYNAEGLEGLHDRPKGRPPRRLTADEEAALAAVIIAGPDPERDGVCAWTRGDLCGWLERRFAKTYHPSSMTRVLRRMGFSRQKVRPSHPRKDAEAQERFKKRGSATS
jgi:transposase